MSKNRALPSEVAGKLTGVSSGRDFMRSCFLVLDHQDGTGTIALEWYEMSIGRDACSFDEFIRTELQTALQIVRLLNAQLPGRVDARELVAWPDDTI